MTSSGQALQYDPILKLFLDLTGPTAGPLKSSTNAYAQAASLTLTDKNCDTTWAQEKAIEMSGRNDNITFNSITSNINFMQSQILTNFQTQNKNSWKHWVIVYTRFLVGCCANKVHEFAADKLRELVVQFVKPGVLLDEQSSFEEDILGVNKKEFLEKEILPLIEANSNLQSLHSEFFDQIFEIV